MIGKTLEQVHREESPRILATLIRLLGDIDRAEEAMQGAFAAALEQWPNSGTPDNPRAWLIRAAHNQGIDRLRRRKSLGEKLRGIDPEDFVSTPPPAPDDEKTLLDDQLRLFFICCHPALSVDAQLALTLRTLSGLTTEEIARAFLVPEVTMAQRLVRAKRKIEAARIPYRVPDEDELPERLEAVLSAIYLVYTEGYAATAGDGILRVDLSHEAIRLARMAVSLLPAYSQTQALLSLLLLHDARRAARVDAEGQIVLMEDQDRSLWDQAQIAEGLELVEAALRRGPLHRFGIEAAIAALHARAKTAAETDWPQIAALYGVLLRVGSTPVIELNHAVAVAMVEGAARGLRLLDALAARGELAGYHLLPAARAELLSREGRNAEAAAMYREALSLVGNDAERRFLEKRLAAIGS